MNFRPMRRLKQALDEDTCVRILSAAKRGTLAVLGDGDYPYAVPLNFVYEGGNLYFHVAKEGHKLDAVLAHDKVSFNVLDEPEKRDPDDWWYYVKSVTVFGRITLLPDGDEKVKALRLLGAKYFPDDYDTDGDIARNLARVNVLCLTVEHMTGKQVEEK